MFAAPPADDFVFGLKRVRDDENAKEVTMRWSEHKPPPEPLPGPDFRAMNKLAAVNDVLDARETAAFRAAHHITLRADAERRRRRLQPRRRRAGDANRPRRQELAGSLRGGARVRRERPDEGHR